MAKYIIEGQVSLHGEIVISGAKNAALKILSAAILADTPSIIENVPRILDIEKLENIIRDLGAKVEVNGNTVTVDPKNINTTELNENLTKKLRGSIVLAGPMLAKFGEVTFFQPGGCLIGARAIDDHLDIFNQMGVALQEKNGKFTLKGKPQACNVILGKMSVTATENAIMAAVLSDGITKIDVAAAEPEIADLILFLNKMGAKITGAGSHTIIVKGVRKLRGTKHRVIPDRIEAGTYLMAAIATNSAVKIVDVIPEHLSIVLKKLRQAGAKFESYIENKKWVIATERHDSLVGVDIDTRTYPGFPTDLQSVYAVLATQTNGPTRIFETLFESRFGYIQEIKKMGANINIESPHIIYVYGQTPLNATAIESSDIRGGAALVLAALIANGKTTITGIELIERGYEDMAQKLTNAGAKIVREK